MSPALTLKLVPLSEVPAGGLPLGEDSLRRVVLVVDDERIIADTLSVILARSGFSVLTAYDGESALDLAQTVPPELLLSDVMLGPGIDGTELALELVDTQPDCRVLLFSGHAATQDLLSRSRACGHDFTLLSKPLHPADLLARIGEAFAPHTVQPARA
jgi:DNA-binding response OmpR family regulator